MIRNLIHWLIPLRDWLYLLQLEEYELKRYVTHIPKRWGRINFEVRDTLDVTSHIRLIILAWLFLVVTPVLILSTTNIVASFIWLIVLPFTTPLLVIPATLLARPIVAIKKRHILRQLQRVVRDYPDLTIIAITGSYGKTTTKYALYELLRCAYATYMIPGNINTALGIAQHVLHNQHILNNKYLIIEVGAYIPGDIAQIVDVVQPDISILTAIGDQHIERFGSHKRLSQAKYEIFSHAPDAIWFTTYAVIDTLTQYNLAHTNTTNVVAGHKTPDDNKTLASAVASFCGVSTAIIEDTLASFTPPERRNEVYHHQGITIIDNSYNISPQTAEQMLLLAHRHANAEQKKLVVLTAGIAEQGSRSQTVNRAFAKQLNTIASRVLLLSSFYAPAIRNELHIPHETVDRALSVINFPAHYVSKDKEILLLFPEHTDLAYPTGR